MRPAPSSLGGAVRSWAAGAMVVAMACSLLVLGAPATASELYGPKGIVPEGVQQGRLGSCYFHAVVAALAKANPQFLRDMMEVSSDGTFTVRFADGRKETAYPEDIRYSREIGYDLSDGVWVAVLFRGYAQRVLRTALSQAVTVSEMAPWLKTYAADFIDSSDALVLAYDRAIRGQVEQNGHIDRARLRTKLVDQMRPLPVPDQIKDSLANLLDSGGFFEALAETIKKNGELFGAYRAVGQGGIAEEVMKALTGGVQFEKNQSGEQAAGALAHALEAHRPVVACTGGSRYYDDLAAGQLLPAGTDNWYVNAHCYTVLGFDGEGRSVTLRNPWGRHPDPNGIFSLPMADFVPAFYGIVTPGR